MDIVELRKRLVGLCDAHSGKFRIRHHQRIRIRHGSGTHLPKNASRKIHCDRREQVRAYELYIELRVALRAQGENLCVGLKNRLVGYFD